MPRFFGALFKGVGQDVRVAALAGASRDDQHFFCHLEIAPFKCVIQLLGRTMPPPFTTRLPPAVLAVSLRGKGRLMDGPAGVLEFS